MKNYSELTGIDPYCRLQIALCPVGVPNVRILTPHDSIDYPELSATIVLDYKFSVLTPYNISVELYNKHYTTEYETAIIIKRLSVDNIDLIPKYDYLANYRNDHNNHNPTSYLGFNGKWTLTFDRPFYQWLHQAQNQGWLIG